jgi:hypothetical protein
VAGDDDAKVAAAQWRVVLDEDDTHRGHGAVAVEVSPLLLVDDNGGADQRDP